MAKLASDSFFPSGAIDVPTNGGLKGGVASHPDLNKPHQRSSMSPLGGNKNHNKYANLPSWRVPSSTMARDIALGSHSTQPVSSSDHPHLGFLSAHELSDTPSPLHLSNPLLPPGPGVVRSTNQAGGYFHPNLSSHSPPASWGIGGASLTRSVSANAAVPPTIYSHLYNGIRGQSAQVENWRLERSNLDALRRRAEKLYRDQQAVIDEMGEEWLKERDEMSHLIHGMRERIQRLEGENAVLKTIASQNNTRMAGLSPQSSVETGSGGKMLDSKSPSPQRPSGRSASDISAALSLPPGLDGASRRPHFAKQGGSASTSPTAAPAAPGHPLSMSPRTEPQQSASTDFLLPSSPELGGDVPIIDVQELDPKLEGIPIKVTAVQKPTFEPESVHPTVADARAAAIYTSPPSADGANQEKRRFVTERPRSDRRRSGLAPLSTLIDQDRAKHILANDESRRLTMHAGHTPNHSLSLFPTMTATESNSAGARSSETTPSAWPLSRFDDFHDTGPSDESDDRAEHSPVLGDNILEGHMDGQVDEDINGLLNPADDVPLKGPLMIKNIPAQDEIFWAHVNKRLDPISRGQDALPKVLRSPELDISRGLADATSSQPEDSIKPEDSNIALDHDDEEVEGQAAVEPDVPLRLRTTSNFGAPFGTTQY